MNSAHARKKECTVNTCSSNTHVQLSLIKSKIRRIFSLEKNWRIAFLDNEELIFSKFPGYSFCCFLLNAQRHRDFVSAVILSAFGGREFFPRLVRGSLISYMDGICDSSKWYFIGNTVTFVINLKNKHCSFRSDFRYVIFKITRSFFLKIITIYPSGSYFLVTSSHNDSL